MLGLGLLVFFCFPSNSFPAFCFFIAILAFRRARTGTKKKKADSTESCPLKKSRQTWNVHTLDVRKKKDFMGRFRYVELEEGCLEMGTHTKRDTETLRAAARSSP